MVWGGNFRYSNNDRICKRMQATFKFGSIQNKRKHHLPAIQPDIKTVSRDQKHDFLIFFVFKNKHYPLKEAQKLKEVNFAYNAVTKLYNI